MSSTMLQLVNQVQSELNLAITPNVSGNPSQDTQQILALMNASGYELTKEYDWQCLENEYRFYTQYITTTATSTNGSYVITGVANTTGLNANYSVTGYNVPQDTYVVSVDSATQVTLSQKCSGTVFSTALSA